MDVPEPVGMRLRRLREEKGIALEEISTKTKISQSYLKALEEGQYKLLPEPVFVRGFLRQVAQVVGDDPEEVVSLWVEEMKRLTPSSPLPPPKKSKLPWIMGIGLAGLLVSLVWWKPYGFQKTKETPPPQNVREKKETPKEIPPPAPSLHDQSFQLVFSSPCWVMAKEGDTILFEGLGKAGDTLNLSFENEVFVRLGDPSAVKLYLQQKPIPLLGKPRKPLNLWVNPEGVRYE